MIAHRIIDFIVEIQMILLLKFHEKTKHFEV